MNSSASSADPTLKTGKTPKLATDRCGPRGSSPSSRYYFYLPAWTLFRKEILRFFSVWSQTLLAPIINASLYIMIFGLSLGSRIDLGSGFSYLQFIVPGLILMGTINNSFANVSSSLFMSRYLGNIVDLLVTPLSTLEFILAYSLAAIFRGLLVGGIIFGITSFFTTLPWPHVIEGLALLLLASLIFAQFGIWAAIFATNFDTLSMFTNFLILPLIYLGGLFYPVSTLPSPWKELSQFNPLYYLIEGFRGAALGSSSVSFEMAAGGALLAAAILSSGSWYFFAASKRFRG